MLKVKLIGASILNTIFMLLFAFPAIAGGGPVEFIVNPTYPLNPGEEYNVRARVYINGPYPSYCKNCPIRLELKDPQEGDYLAQSSDKTNEDGVIEAKVISKVGGTRIVIATNITGPEGVITSNSYALLMYKNSTAPTPTATPFVMPPAPEMVYPQDGQTIDLEGAYMFKVKPVAGSTGYLFGLFQDDNMVYENWRDSRILSTTEFALWENNPFHAKFHSGEMKVWIRAYVNNQWTDARIITIYLKPRANNNELRTALPTKLPQPPITPKVLSTPPTSLPLQVVTVTDSSATAALQEKVNKLQQELVESQQRESILEQRLNQILSWIKHFFPFFK